MTPTSPLSASFRRVLTWLPAAFCAASLALSAGCSERVMRAQSPDELEKKLESDTQLISDVAVPYGLNPVEVEAVGLVTGLPGTGSDPEPSPYRAVLLGEMQKRGIKNPNQVLADPSTALVLVRGVLRPGIQKGDAFDVEVRIPSRDRTTSLRGGYLLLTKLREHAVLGGEVREGNLLAVAEGPIMVDPGSGPDDKISLTRGRVLGGGKALKERSLALVLQPGKQSVRNSSLVGAAIDARFHRYVKGNKEGVASPKTDEHVELAVHARYKNNLPRYLNVIRAIPLREPAAQRSERMKMLERQLLDPFTASKAALRLEALGHEAVPVLKKGLDSDDPEVRFYAAEALAYLDQPQSAAALAQAAKDEPAFRVFALTALSALDDTASFEALRDLLDVDSAETRYGAFRALTALDEKDPFVRGEMLGGQFNYHMLETSGPPMVHATRGVKPEIVLFGHDQRLNTPVLLDAGNNVLVQSEGFDQVRVSRFVPGEPDQSRLVDATVNDLIRAVMDVGGSYPDVVQVLQQAKEKKVLTARFEVDALPEARPYARKGDDKLASADDEGKRRFTVSNPIPNLFPKRETPAEEPEKVPEADGDEQEGKKGKDKGDEEKAKSGWGKFPRFFGKKDAE